MDHPKPRRFSLLSGKRISRPTETERLNSFLADSDPKLLASLHEEERQRRRARLRAAIGLVLAFTAGAALVWLLVRPKPPAPAQSARPAAARELEGAKRLVREGWRNYTYMQRDKALSSFEMATVLAPTDPDAWNGLGWARWYQEQPGAEEAFRRCLSLNPTHPMALNGLGNLYFQAGRFAEAEPILKSAGNRGQLAVLYLNQGRFAEAVPLLEALEREAPEDPLIQRLHQAAVSRRIEPGLRRTVQPFYRKGVLEPTTRGWRYYWRRDYLMAASTFVQAITEDPNDVEALNGYGWSSFRQGNVEKAKTLFQRAQELEPNSSTARDGLAHCLKAEGRTDEAIALWQSLAGKGSAVFDGTEGLAWTYYERGDYRHAAPYLLRLTERYPDDEKTREVLKTALEKLGES